MPTDYFPKASAKLPAQKIVAPITTPPAAVIKDAPKINSSTMNLSTEIFDKFGSNPVALQTAMAFAKAKPDATMESVEAHVAAKARDAELEIMKSELAKVQVSIAAIEAKKLKKHRRAKRSIWRKAALIDIMCELCRGKIWSGLHTLSKFIAIFHF